MVGKGGIPTQVVGERGGGEGEEGGGREGHTQVVEGEVPGEVVGVGGASPVWTGACQELHPLLRHLCLLHHMSCM